MAPKAGLRRILLITVPAAAVVAGVALTVGSANADANWQYYGAAGSCHQVASLDTDADGVANQLALNSDGDCDFETNFWDTDGIDEVMDAGSVDQDGNGIVELSLDLTAGLYWTDPEQDGVLAGPFTLPPPASTTTVPSGGAYVGGGDPYATDFSASSSGFGGAYVGGPPYSGLINYTTSDTLGTISVGGGGSPLTNNVQLNEVIIKQLEFHPPCYYSNNGC